MATPAEPLASPAPKYRLAVITVEIGAPSETFIRRHMEDLLPGETVVVAREDRRDHAAGSPFPSLVIEAPRRDLAWFWHSGVYLLGLGKLKPVEIGVARFLERHGVEVILSQYLNRSLQWLRVARAMGVPFFAHAHGYDISKCLREPETRRRYLELEAADGVITMSELSRRRLIEIGLSGHRIHVIPYGVDVPKRPLERSPGTEVRCLAVGRMVAKKAPSLTVDAFARALAVHPDMRLDFVGDGELFADLKRMVAERGLEGRVILHGSQPNTVVLDLLRRADIFLQHSRTDPDTGDEEGLPVAILEAMANALPVVSTRHAGIPEAVIEGVTGCLVDEGDTEGMAEHIVRLARDADLRRRMGHAGWQRALRFFSWPHERARLLELLRLAPAENVVSG